MHSAVKCHRKYKISITSITVNIYEFWQWRIQKVMDHMAASLDTIHIYILRIIWLRFDIMFVVGGCEV